MAGSSGVGNLASAVTTIISHVSILLLEQTGDIILTIYFGIFIAFTTALNDDDDLYAC